MEDCIFCRIARKEIPAEIIYEDEDFMAFLDIRPSMEGQTLVIPKVHPGGYAFDMDNHAYERLLVAAKTVGKILDKAMGTRRTCLVIEGFDVPHVHVKLYPVKEGYLKIFPVFDENPEKLKKLSEKIRGAVNG